MLIGRISLCICFFTLRPFCRANQDVVHHLAWIVHTDDGLVRHRGFVAAAVGIDY